MNKNYKENMRKKCYENKKFKLLFLRDIWCYLPSQNHQKLRKRQNQFVKQFLLSLRLAKEMSLKFKQKMILLIKMFELVMNLVLSILFSLQIW